MKKKQTKNQIVEKLIKSTGLRARINAHCASCIYDEIISGSWKRQVTECTVTNCPIWDVRPKIASKDQKQTSKIHPTPLDDCLTDNHTYGPEWAINLPGISS